MSLAVGGPANVESGNTAVYEVDYNGSDPLPTYTINWGDGSSTTGNSRNPTHAYTFERYLDGGTYTVDSRAITLSASEGTSSITSTVGSPGVLPNYGAGTLTPGGTVTAIQGQPVTLGAGFTDPDFVPGTYTAPLGWSIEFDANDDYSENVYPANASQASTTYTYDVPGTYTVVWGALYYDSNSPFGTGGANKQPFFTVADEQVIVQHATPTVSVTDTIDADEGVSVTPQFTLPSGSEESYPTWTIDWGDGNVTSSTYYHQYATPGSYTIHAIATTNEGTYTATCGASIAAPTITVSDRYGAAYESDQFADDFIVTRSFADALPLNVSFTIGGDATSGEYELTDASTGQILTNSVTIPANQMFSTIVVTPVEDNTPEWTNDVSLTLESSSAYTLGSASFASTEIVNHDLSATLGDGSGNIILDGSDDGTQNLVPLVLKFPSEMETGAILTLTDSADTKADVWTTPMPGSSDQPILGDVDATYTSSMTWTYGTDTLPAATLWVGGTDGSTSMDDTSFTLSDSDATAADPPTHPTTQSASTKPATGITIDIMSYNNPNDPGTPGTKDVTDNPTPRPWLVGQMVDLVATLQAPVSMMKSYNIVWDQPGGNVLRAWSRNTSPSTAIGLSADDGGPVAFTGLAAHTGLSQSRLDFFWVSTPAAAGSFSAYTITARLPFQSDEVGSYASASVTFDVYTPTSQVTMRQGVPGTWVHPSGPLVIGLGPDAPANMSYGISWSGTVQTPQPQSGTAFSQGQFNYLQIVLPSTGTMRAVNGNWQYGRSAGIWALDNKNYIIPASAVDANGNQVIVTPFNAPNGAHAWLTDATPGFSADSPANSLLTAGMTDIQVLTEFNTYLMYLPPGINSQWVPLDVQDWSYIVSANKATGVMSLTNKNKWIFGFLPATQEPSWLNVLINGNTWV